MFQHHIRHVVTSASAILFILIAVVPASARTHPGDQPAAHTPSGYNCPLQRIDAQFVRCDVHTGNGVAAPAWIPTRR